MVITVLLGIHVLHFAYEFVFETQVVYLLILDKE